MTKPTVSFRHFSGSGPLSVYWHQGPYGDATEAIAGKGVAWLAHNGQLLGVEFDDVRWDGDDQVIELPNGDVVSVRVRRGRTTVHVKHRRRGHAA